MMSKTNTVLQNDFREDENKESNQIIFNSLIECLPVAVVIFDRNLRFVAASDKFFEESPLKKENVKQNDHWYTLIPDMPRKWKAIHQRCLNGERLSCDSDPFYRQDGSIEWWKWEILPWHHLSNEVEGVVLYVENITSQKSLEKTLRDSIRSLKKSNNKLSRFAHTCAHDLNQSLRSIALYAQIINMDYAETTDPSLKEHLNYMLKTIEYMKNFISSSLDYSHQKNKEIVFNNTCMTEVITSVLTVMKSEIQNKNATVNYSSLPVVYANKNLLIQLIQNLVSNALKYNRESFPVIDISVSDRGTFWVFSVQDNGIGIESKHLKKIFSEHKRLNSDPQYEGYGLGLHQCNKIIRDHGGKIWATSVPTKGSTIFFTLLKESYRRGDTGIA